MCFSINFSWISLFSERGITAELLVYLTDGDIDEILPADGDRVRFRKGWQALVQSNRDLRTNSNSREISASQIAVSSPEGAGETRSLQSWQIINLETILDCREGSLLRTFFNNRRALDRKRREDLIDLIIQYFTERKLSLSCKSMDRLSEEIQQEFSSELKVVYSVHSHLFCSPIGKLLMKNFDPIVRIFREFYKIIKNYKKYYF